MRTSRQRRDASRTFVLKATNAWGSDTQTFTLEVVSPPTLTNRANPSAVLGAGYLYDADGRVAASGTGPITWSSSLTPASFSIDAQTGAIQWTPVSLGSYAACVQAANAVGSSQECFTVTVAPATIGEDAGFGGAPTFLSHPSTTAFCGASYHYTGTRVPEVSGAGPFTYALAAVEGASLPEGLEVDAATGALSWTPTAEQSGVHPVTLIVESASGRAQQTFSIVVDCAPGRAGQVGCGCTSSALDWLVVSVVLLARRRRNFGVTGT